MKEHYDFWIEKAKEHQEKKQFEEAVKCYDKIRKIQKSIEQKDFWLQKGIFLFEVGQYEEALTCFEKEIEINKEGFDSYFWMGITLYRLKNYPQSLENIDKGL